MGYVPPPAPPDDWYRLNNNRLSIDSIRVSAEWLLSQKLWLPIYEQGGIDLIIQEGLGRRPKDPAGRVK